MTKIPEQLPKYEDEGAQCRHSKILKVTGREQFSQKLLGTPEFIVAMSKQTVFIIFPVNYPLNSQVDAKQDSVWCMLHGIETGTDQREVPTVLNAEDIDRVWQEESVAQTCRLL